MWCTQSNTHAEQVGPYTNNVKELEAFRKVCPLCGKTADLVPARQALLESHQGAYQCEPCGIRMNLDLSRVRFARLLLPLTLLFAVAVIGLPAEHSSRLFVAWSTSTIVAIAYVLWTSPLKEVEPPA